MAAENIGVTRYAVASLRPRWQRGVFLVNGLVGDEVGKVYAQRYFPPEAKAQVQPILDAMELAPWADSTPGAIGRNWQKRVGLARALVLKPEVLLVDSPLTGLDLRHVNWWLGFLDALSRGHAFPGGRPMTLVVTTADLRPWKNRARQFAVLKGKRFSVLGAWSQLEAVTDELVQELLTT